MTFKCEWCGGEIDSFPLTRQYCSSECHNYAINYAVERLDAMFEEDKDVPTKAEFKSRQQRARKWTPDKMHERIDELREVA
jgi:hypothetical protein